jgi:hypothetical protein
MGSQDQGTHVFSELDSMKKQMSQMFDMMGKFMAVQAHGDTIM